MKNLTAIKGLLLKIWCIDIYAKISAKIWIQKHNWLTAMWLFKRGIEVIRGNEGVVSSREVYSKGGFKYYQMEISKFPFSKDSDYSNF